MSSPNPAQQNNRPLWPVKPGQQQYEAQHPNNQQYGGYTHYPQPGHIDAWPATYMQPHYAKPVQARPQPPMKGLATPIAELPAAFIAELPAALPPAPPTSTSQQQLSEDSRLAHRLSRLDLKEAETSQRSNSSLGLQQSLQQLSGDEQYARRLSTSEIHDQERRLKSSSNVSLRPLQYASQPSTSPHLQQTQLLKTSQSVSQFVPHGSDSFSPPIELSPNPFPEVVVEPQPRSVVRKPLNSSSPTPPFTAHIPSAPSDAATLPAYLEQHRQVPYPPQWTLAPATMTLYSSIAYTPKSDWLEIPHLREWRTVRFTNDAFKLTLPSYNFSFKTSGGSMRDPKFMWSMKSGDKNDKKSQSASWTYTLRIDRHNGIRKSELLIPPKGKEVLTTYIRAPNYDSLRFVGPDGRLYLWVAHTKLSSVNGARYDTIRHALFTSTHGQHDPLYGDIIADHTYWDGYVDHTEIHSGFSCKGCNASPIQGLRWKCTFCEQHNICDSCRCSNNSVLTGCALTLLNLPDEALHIRSSSVDPALVVATLQILKDWELHTLRQEKQRDPQGFEISEKHARECELGKISYWRGGDFEKKGAKTMNIKHGTVIKMRAVLLGEAETTSGSKKSSGNKSRTPVANSDTVGGARNTASTGSGGNALEDTSELIVRK